MCLKRELGIFFYSLFPNKKDDDMRKEFATMYSLDDKINSLF